MATTKLQISRSQVRIVPQETTAIQVGPKGRAAFITHGFHNARTYRLAFQMNLGRTQPGEDFDQAEWRDIPGQVYQYDARRETATGIAGELPDGTWVRVWVVRLDGRDDAHMHVSVRTD